uniref:Enoyl-CoA delta isomerase 1, mitochondrial n=1 Tax=Equus asinus TaxID=9793 RepID=A0A9L0IF55_EQUAS
MPASHGDSCGWRQEGRRPSCGVCPGPLLDRDPHQASRPGNPPPCSPSVLLRSPLRGKALGCTEPAAGGGNGARRFGSQRVLVEPDPAAGVAVMKFKNPPVNSLSLELLTEFVISLEKLENDKTFRGVILSSDCPGVFSAGLDLTEMCGRNPAHYAEYWKAVQELWLRLYLSNLVLIAAISGACPAGGCLISLTCDYRVLADNPKCLIGLNETLLGIIAPFWFRDTLVNTIGHRAAERALQLGLLFPPAEALQVGMVDQVVPEDQVQSTALSVMAQWMAIPDHARQLTKNMMRKPTVDRLLKQRDTDIQNFVSFISRDSIQKSLQMYLEKLKQKKG